MVQPVSQINSSPRRRLWNTSCRPRSRGRVLGVFAVVVVTFLIAMLQVSLFTPSAHRYRHELQLQDNHRGQRFTETSMNSTTTTTTTQSTSTPRQFPKYNISEVAVCAGSNNITLASLLRTLDPKFTFCVPEDVDAVFQDMGVWLDVVVGICASGMNPTEIRERVLTVLDTRSSLPPEPLSTITAENLLSVALCSQPYTPNKMPTTHRFDGYNTQIKPDTNNLQRLHKALFELVPMDAIASLDEFEFNLATKLPLVSSLFSNTESVPEVGKLALVVAGVASPAAPYRFYTGRWVHALDQIYERFRLYLSRITPYERTLLISFFDAHHGYVNPALLREASILLGLKETFAFAISNDDLMLKNQPLPRALWSSGNIATLPAWSGPSPPTLDETIKRNKTSPTSSTPPASVALVIPFHDGELAKIRNSFAMFASNVGTPASANTTLPQQQKLQKLVKLEHTVPFILALNDDFETSSGKVMRKTILRMWKEFAPSNLKLYLLSLRQPKNTNHYDGAAMSFFQLQAFLGKYVKTIQIMETDVVPIQSDWIGRLVKEAKGACEEWWMKGSSQQCSPILNYRTDMRVDFHINGNSLYAVGCEEFDNYIRRVQAFYTPHAPVGGQCQMMGGCETGKAFEGGYDHVLYRYKQDPLTYHYSRNILSKFQYTANVLNYCEEKYNSTRILNRNPNAFLVHSKFQMYSEEHRIVVDAFNTMFSRQPSPTELKSWWLKLHYNLSTVGEFFKHMCAEIEYRSFAAIGVRAPQCTQTPQSQRLQQIKQSELKTQQPKQHHLRLPHQQQQQQRQHIHIKPTNTTYIHVEAMSSQQLQCTLPILSSMGVKIKSSGDGVVCDEFGECEAGELPSLMSTYDDLDFVLCGGNPIQCQSLLAKGRPIVFYISMQAIVHAFLTIGGLDMIERWELALITLIRSDLVTAVASDAFASSYIHAKTSITPMLIPSWCGSSAFNHKQIMNGGHTISIEPLYLPARHEILLATPQVASQLSQMDQELMKKISTMLEERTKNRLTAKPILNMYQGGTNDFNIARHPAVVVLPCGQLSIDLDIISYYRLAIPIFVPSADFYKRLFSHYLYGTFGPLVENQAYWITQITKLATWPGVQQFESEEDLVSKLSSADFDKISLQMRKHSLSQRPVITTKWNEVVMQAQQQKLVLLQQLQLRQQEQLRQEQQHEEEELRRAQERRNQHDEHIAGPHNLTRPIKNIH
eukprot:m.236892 g.236892  ORF g.236892 m.236892 type:complete len:1211 (+) comp33693_c0_seq4:1363-4995(+)